MPALIAHALTLAIVPLVVLAAARWHTTAVRRAFTDGKSEADATRYAEGYVAGLSRVTADRAGRLDR